MMSSSGSWSMIDARDGQPADAGVEDADRREAVAHEVRPGSWPAFLRSLALRSRAGQPVGGQHAGDRPAQMALPGHPAAAVELGNGAPQHAAVDDEHDDPGDDPPDVAGEPAEHQQERQPAEDQPGGADVVGLQPAADVADQPGAQAADDPDDRGGPDEPRHPGQRHQEAEHQCRHGVGGQVLPAPVQQRGEDDAPQAVGLQGPDAVAVQRVVGQLVDELDEVEQHHERQDGGAADLPGRRLRVRAAGSPGSPMADSSATHPPTSCPELAVQRLLGIIQATGVGAGRQILPSRVAHRPCGRSDQRAFDTPNAPGNISR